MFLYTVTSESYKKLHLYKLGLTTNPHGRLGTYLTGCPPSQDLTYDLYYSGLWKTDATTTEELEDLEEEFHNTFHRYRLKRQIPGDSEWFQFPWDPSERFEGFMNRKGFQKIVYRDLERVHPRFLQRSYDRNLHFIPRQDQRLHKLERIQSGVITAIQNFLVSDQRSGFVIAPCGSGKTRMTCEAIRGLERVIICLPRELIQDQWSETLTGLGVFDRENMYRIGGEKGTTSSEEIQEIFKRETYCLLTTYASSHLLVPYVTDRVQLWIGDEAHHMAGLVTYEDQGEGITRKLLLKIIDHSIRRLFLTYTPRCIQTTEVGRTYFSMDDDRIFGSVLAELKLKDLIQDGVLPDYRVWTLKNTVRHPDEIEEIALLIQEAWRAREVVRRVEKPVLHHLVVFTRTNEEGRRLQEVLQKYLPDTLILQLQAGTPGIHQKIEEYKRTERAILINCKLLNEGVDIPVIQSVMITYPKESRSEITQMLFRAGRWAPDKPLFHILIPCLREMDGVEEVLMTLAQGDERIQDQILLGSQRNIAGEKEKIGEMGEIFDKKDQTECIVIEEYEGLNPEEIQRCFQKVRVGLWGSHNKRWIRDFCVKHTIKTSLEYHEWRIRMPELMTDPCYEGMSWYDYLHPRKEKISARRFVEDWIDRFGLDSTSYNIWWMEQTAEIQKSLPSLQNITDGYFGKDITNLRFVIDQYSQKNHFTWD